MGRILEKFTQNLPQIQIAHLQKELFRARERGEYRTQASFRAEFQSRLRDLLQKEVKLRYEPIQMAEGDPRSSELINHLVQALSEDIDALFVDSNELSLTAEAQATLFREEIVNRLRSALSEAEREISRLEFLSGNQLGYKDALVETFRTSDSRLPRTDPIAELVYRDPKLASSIGPDYDMAIEATLDGLVLPIKSSATLSFSSIKDQQNHDIRMLSERFSLRVEPSTVSVGPTVETGNILNVIDKRKGTFWQKRILTESILADGAKLNLLLDLGGLKEINFIEIHPFGESPLELSSLYYIDSEALVREIELPEPLKLKEQTRVFVNPVIASKIMLLLTQRSPSASFRQQEDKHLVEYSFGIDNILGGKLSYESRGYFVTKTMSSSQISRVSLVAKENTRVTNTNEPGVLLDEDTLPSIEYWIHYREYDQGGALLWSDFIPIRPLNSDLVIERLIPRTDSSARLNFMIDGGMDGDGGDPSELELYRDKVLILRPMDYTMSPDIPHPSLTQAGYAELRIPGSHERQMEYVARYRPLHTKENAPVEFRDPTGTFRYNRDSSVEFTRPSGSRATESQLNLLIIMRGDPSPKHTAVIDEILLCIG
jgi:hypothetical protein